MCGIIGIMFKKSGNLGEYLFRMMKTLQHRGTDSAGVSIYTDEPREDNEFILIAEVADTPGAIGELGNAIGSAGGDIRSISFRASPHGETGLNTYIIRVPDEESLRSVVNNVNATETGKVYSFGRKIKVIKDLGEAKTLEKGYKISEMTGTHGLGHVRFSTESRVDRSHAHPFHTSVFPDISVVHNGQITNYHKIRGKLEREGFSFATSNDSEVIVYFIVNQLNQGKSLEEALEDSVEKLDGPFSYIVSTPESIGIARDKLGLRPMALTQDDEGYYAASEEVALLSVCDDSDIDYLKPGEVQVFER
ncbi:MAG: class II glutamine amidotransferase [Hadesarchaea archaeon]|nr:class II glutamine amidotransferase [Hadesarchaea archaeon]